MTLRVLENFAGIGTQRMALENLGITHEVVGITEIDKFAIKSYEAIHGEVNNLGDISKVDPNDVPDHDLFTYSFPCQDISVAGKGRGFEKGSGTRSGLLWECEKVIRAKKPKYLLMENVKNLVSKKFKPGFEEWLQALEGMGYTNYWQVLNAKDYGIPQNRERVFCVSILGEHEPYEFPEKETLELRLKDILEHEVDEKFYLDNDKAKQLIATVWDKEQLAPTLDTMQGGWRQPSVIVDDTQGFEDTPRIYKDYAPSLRSSRSGLKTIETSTKGNGGVGSNNAPKVLDNFQIRKLTPKEEFGRMGRQAVETFNENDVKHSDTINPFNKRVSSDDGVSPTLTTRPEGFKTAILPVSKDLRIRKLTPKECWRLMGISDDDFAKAQEVNSNSQLYKQAGNAIVVDVLEALFESMFK